MTLSVCMMVRDEEKNLRRALESVRGVADEIVVIDTGSVDATVSIAEGFGARVFHHSWEDHFSKPHNFGWDQTRGEWLLWMDGDESLAESSIPHLRECMKRKDIGGYFLQRQEILDSDDPNCYTEMLMLRLHRRDIPARFVGRYHTQIIIPDRDCSPSERWAVARCHVKLRHWRYKADTLLRSRRAARILAEELKDEPDNLYVMIELANSLDELGDPRAVELRREVVRRLNPADEYPPTVAVVYTLDFMITHAEEARALGLSFADLQGMCERWFPCSAPLRWAVAQRLFSEGDFQGAARELAELIRLLDTDELDKLLPFDPRTRWDAEFNLAVCLTRLARLDDAELFFRRCLLNPNRAAAAKVNLETIEALRKIV